MNIPKDLNPSTNTIFKGIVTDGSGKKSEVLLARDENGEISITTDDSENIGTPEQWKEFYKRYKAIAGVAPKDSFVMPSDAHNEPLPGTKQTQTFIDYDRGLHIKLQEAYEQSYSNKAIIDQKTNFTIGGGFDFKGASKKSTAQEAKRWEYNNQIATNLGLFGILEDAVYQYINYGNCCVYATKKGIIDHWRVKYCRIETQGQVDLKKMIIAFDKQRAFADNITTYRAPIYPRTSTVNMGYKLNDRGETIPDLTDATVFFVKNPKGDREYWGLPDHNAGILLYKTQYYISRYQEQAFVRGLMPKYMVVFYGENQKALLEKMERFVESTNGLQNSHTPIFMEATGKSEGGSNIEIIDLTRRNEGEFLELEQKTREGIYQTHRFPPALASQEVSGKLGSSKELKDAYTLVYNSMIRPMQMYLAKELFIPLFKWLDEVYKTTFIEDFIGIKDAPPISLTELGVLNTIETRTLQGYEDVPLPDDPILQRLMYVPQNLLPFYTQLWLSQQANAQPDQNPNPNPSTNP